MLLPGIERACIDRRKLADYALNSGNRKRCGRARLVGVGANLPCGHDGCSWRAVCDGTDRLAARLAKGQVGTIVDELSGNVVLVEFSDVDGIAYALEPIPVGSLIELHHAPAMAA
ncbi:MAG: DUF4926 domain-containing protein [Rhodocyclaceae bacterium]|nr:DUF4926 domain-containing protein [Rhodocyclaceae bacterium]